MVDRIKDMTQVILPTGYVMMEIIVPERKIITPEGVEDEDKYGVIVAKHEDVKDIEIGDLAIQIEGSHIMGIEYMDPNGDKKIYGTTHRMSIAVAVKPDNFMEDANPASGKNLMV